jgi:hypothetical protein
VGGAVLLAIENAPQIKELAPIRCLIGLFSGGTFFTTTDTMSPENFLDYGWRFPLLRAHC